VGQSWHTPKLNNGPPYYEADVSLVVGSEPFQSATCATYFFEPCVTVAITNRYLHLNKNECKRQIDAGSLPRTAENVP
jgi:hypothetical protein